MRFPHTQLRADPAPRHLLTLYLHLYGCDRLLPRADGTFAHIPQQPRSE